MSSRGNLQRKCVKGHPKPAGKCSSRCVRWYPRLELSPRPRRHPPVRGPGRLPHPQPKPRPPWPTPWPARSHGDHPRPDHTHRQPVPGPLAGPHPHQPSRADRGQIHRPAGRPRATLHRRPTAQAAGTAGGPGHLRPARGRRPPGRQAGWAGPPAHPGRAPLPAPGAFQQAVTWRLHRPQRRHRRHPTSACPTTEVIALAPEQIDLLLEAAERAPSPWLGPWTVLAAATGARNGELCGLEWGDLDLEGGTIRFRQALTNIDPAVLPDLADGHPGAGWGQPRGTRRGAAQVPPPAARSSPCHRSRSSSAPIAAGGPSPPRPSASPPPSGCA